MKKIGQVTLDDSCYPGRDLYTDGAIEDEMLEIAKSTDPSQFNRVIGEKKSWPILYHFSHIRENILSWLPFTGKESVLEIGSGCGAVTGALLRGAGEVTCIDLSMKRSEINAWRHRDQENLTIHVGNFQDIEKKLTKTYDYITLIGVFEYGEAYIQSQDPYVDFLRIIRKRLKPGGKILIAIENRFGLKYWAGCTEDHFGTLFEGLEGYPTTEGVKTFTKKELLRLLQRAGDLKSTWYYPFPDYKFPMTIFSDRRLPGKGELNRTEYNFDRLRMNLFQESAVYDSLLDNDLYPEFANSFFLIAGEEEWQPAEAYVKFSNERDPRFDLRTQILQKGEERWATKTPTDACAMEHVRRIHKVGQGLKEAYEKQGLLVNRCQAEEEGVRLEYLEGITLEELLDRRMGRRDFEGMKTLLFQYLDKAEAIHCTRDFVMTQDFERVFGRVQVPEGQKSGDLTNIDLVPANILLGGPVQKGGSGEALEAQPYVMDYEWTFDFPIPAGFLKYRMIHYYLESDGKRHVAKSLGLYQAAGISEEDRRIYAKMEEGFQRYLTGKHIPMLQLYDAISPGKLDVMDYYKRIQGSGDGRRLQVFFDRGQDFQECDSFRYPMTRKGIAIDVPVPAGTRRMRLDPGEVPGGFRVRTLRWRDKGRASFYTNGFSLGDQKYYFGGGDPQLILENVPRDARILTLELEALKEQEAQKEFWACFARQDGEKNAQILELKNTLKQRERLIHEMENTKVWRLYRKLKPEGK
ncbi:MAG: class I SAM-dependent methyltransferase [Eubacteriales bacterium]|nr:class I SAM-dependent methyltransferase [Eubacteriales bacterium]